MVFFPQATMFGEMIGKRASRFSDSILFKGAIAR